MDSAQRHRRVRLLVRVVRIGLLAGAVAVAFIGGGYVWDWVQRSREDAACNQSPFPAIEASIPEAQPAEDPVLDPPLEFFDALVRTDPDDSGMHDRERKLTELRRKPPAAAPPAVVPAGEYSVQVGAFRSKRSAVELAARLAGHGFDAYIKEARIANGTTVHRVRAGRLADVAAARALAERIEQQAHLSTHITRR